jgi:integrase
VELVAALRRLKATHAAEGYEAQVGDGYVACDEYGAPLHPERVSEEFEREGKRAGLPRIVLHGTRHTSATLLDEEGVPEADNSMWHGHTLGGRVSTTRKHYIHPDVGRRLRAAGAVLAAAYRTEHAGPGRSRTAG